MFGYPDETLSLVFDILFSNCYRKVIDVFKVSDAVLLEDKPGKKYSKFMSKVKSSTPNKLRVIVFLGISSVTRR